MSIKRFIRIILGFLPLAIHMYFEKFIYGVTDMISNWTLPVFKITGFIPETDMNVSLVICGEYNRFKIWPYVLFNEIPTPTFVGEKNILEILKQKNELCDVDLILMPVNPLTTLFFRQKGWSIIPRYVNAVVDVSRPLSEIICGKSVKDDLRIIKKYDYSFHVENNVDQLDKFYKSMLVPTVKCSHKDSANISSWQTIKELASNGFMLKVCIDGEWVAGILATFEGEETLRISNLGWLNGDPEIKKKQVISAGTYELIRYAKDNNYKRLDMGGCEPFANGGPLKYKFKFNPIIELPQLAISGDGLIEAKSFIAVKYNLKSKGGQYILKKHPVIHCEDDTEIGVISWNSPLPSCYKKMIAQGVVWKNLGEGND